MARIRRWLQCLSGFSAGWRNTSQRSDAALLHIWYDIEAQARDALTRHVSRWASLDHVLDRAAARRHTLQHFFSRLGETCLELLLRALERRGDGLRPKSVTLQRKGVARDDYRCERDYLLCPAHSVAHPRHAPTCRLQDQAARSSKCRRAAQS